MSKLLKIKIDVTKVDAKRLFEGEKGTYLDVDVWINDDPDKYGNIASVQQHTKKDEEKIYLGNGKWFTAKEGNSDISWVGKKAENNEGKAQTGSMSNINDLPGSDIDDGSDIPF